MARKDTPPKAQVRAALYCRVSSEEQVDGFSLDAQRRLLTDYCRDRGWLLAGDYADEGRSARTDKIEKRPAFKLMLEDAAEGRFDVVAVHKIDRFARNIRVTFECLEHLAKHDVTFVATAQPDLDYTRPEGRLFLGMMATLAQYYSDNLSQETMKGRAERKAQGWYNGHLPFGVLKGADGIPVADPATIAGLELAFAHAAEGASDLVVAQALNAAGYRTSGVRTGKPEPFSKDTVCKMLQNRFYLGELPGERPADAAPARHQAVIAADVFAAALRERERKATSGHGVRPGARTYSLSGLCRCARCGGRLRIQYAKGKPRLFCATRTQEGGCDYRSSQLLVYEAQLAAYLTSFAIPADYRAQLRAYVDHTQPDAEDIPAQRQRIARQQARLRQLFQLEDISEAEYLAERETHKRALAALEARETGDNTHLDRLATLLADAAAGWHRATQEQRNELARSLFEEITIEDARVTRVKPWPELAGFFALDNAKRDPTSSSHVHRGGSDGHHLRTVQKGASHPCHEWPHRGRRSPPDRAGASPP